MLTVVFIEYFEKSKKNVICSSIIWNAVCVLEMPQGNVNRMSANVTRTVQVQPGTKWESCQRAARYRMWGRVKKSGTHLPLVSSERLERHPARVAPHLGSVVVRSRQQEMAIGGCTRKEGRKKRDFWNNWGRFHRSSVEDVVQNESITLEANSRHQVLVGGHCVQTLPVSQLPDFTGVITASCG